MMNRGVLQSSPVHQMMAPGNPNWWSMNSFMRPQPTLVSPSSISNFMPPPNSLPNPHNNNSNTSDGCVQVHEYNMMNMSNSCVNSSSLPWINNTDDKHVQDHQQFPHESFSQLLFGGVFTGEEQIMLQQPTFIDHTKQESSVDSYNNNDNNNHQESRLGVPIKANWSNHPNYPQMNLIPVSSPQSCVTTFSSSNNNNNNNNNNVLDFSSSKSSDNNLRARHPDRSSECNSTATGGALKKAKVQASSSQSTFKVRKEKLGDRITALHQLVSPFGKTDTASVLLEAIGYIRFLHNQVQALSIPYLNSGAGNQRQPHSVQGERNSKFPEDPGQLLNENCLKRKGHPDQESYEEPKDLRSRGLCLVPVACTLHVGNDNGADYWAPALGGGFR